MAAGHREAARSVLDDGEYAATLDLAGVERSYSGRRRHRARSRRPLLPTQPIRAPNATHRFSGGTSKIKPPIATAPPQKFCELLAWHMASGTQPDASSKPRESWRSDHLAEAV